MLSGTFVLSDSLSPKPLKNPDIEVLEEGLVSGEDFTTDAGVSVISGTLKSLTEAFVVWAASFEISSVWVSFSKRDVIGTPEIISQVSQEEIMNYYRTFYSPQNVTTIIVGDFDFNDVLKKVQKEFNWGDRPIPPDRNLQIDKPTNETIYIENEANITSSFMMFGYLGVPARDLKNLIALEMLAVILGEGTSSRLYVNLIENIEENIFNLIDSESYSFKDGSNFFIQANFNSQYKDRAIELVKEEIEKLKDTITERELNKAKKKLKSRFACEAETVSEIGESIGYYMTVCDDLDLAEQYIPTCDSLTIEDLQEVAKKYLNINNAVISILKPKSL